MLNQGACKTNVTDYMTTGAPVSGSSAADAFQQKNLQNSTKIRETMGLHPRAPPLVDRKLGDVLSHLPSMRRIHVAVHLCLVLHCGYYVYDGCSNNL